jgi:hypothetical protein
MASQPNDRILITKVPKPSVDLNQALPKIAALTGRSTLRTGIDILRAMIGPRRFSAMEYFTYGAWQEVEGTRTYLGGVKNLQLNRSMAVKGNHDQTSLFNDKFLTGLILSANSFPVPETRAVFAVERSFGGVTTLKTAHELAAWLAEERNLPVFGKPVDGSMSLGSVPLRAAGQGQIDIAGRPVQAAALAGEVASQYSRGWLMQELLRQPPDVETLIGPGVGSIRVVTLWEAAGPQVLYAVWRHPAVGTWVDVPISGKPTTNCALDITTGEVLRAWLGDLYSGKLVTHSLVSPDLPIVGYRVPGWERTSAMCCGAHRLFPGHALLGWDIALTARGPVISEINANPLHMSYQRAYGQGFLHVEHVERLDAARALISARVGAKRK